nr:hypothetical protein GCM10020063_060200 [Dactylosporangium thailandense]
MTEPATTPPGDDDLAALYATLAALDLPPAQRQLLDNILAMARDMTPTDEPVAAGFAAAYAPGAAALIAAYAHGGPLLVSHAPGGGHPVMISRMISR